MSSLWPCARKVSISGLVAFTMPASFSSKDRVLTVEIELPPIPVQSKDPLKDGREGRDCSRAGYAVQTIPGEFAAPRQPRIEAFAGSRINRPCIDLFRSLYLRGGKAPFLVGSLALQDAGSNWHLWDRRSLRL